MKLKALFLSVVMLTSFCIVDDSSARRTPSGPTQQTTALAVAHACEGLLISFARNPSLGSQIMDIYNDVIDDIMRLNLTDTKTDIAEARGIVAGGLMVAYARNPSLRVQLFSMADMCNNDIDAL